MPTIEDVGTWSGRDVVGPDGEKIGTLDHLYVDRESGRPTFLAVKTGLFGLSSSLVPSAEARATDGAIAVPFAKSTVKDAPNVESDDRLTEAEEARLYDHYGLGDYTPYTGPDHDALTRLAQTEPEDDRAPGAPDAPPGRTRLRRYVVLENADDHGARS